MSLPVTLPLRTVASAAALIAAAMLAGCSEPNAATAVPLGGPLCAYSDASAGTACSGSAVLCFDYQGNPNDVCFCSDASVVCGVHP